MDSVRRVVLPFAALALIAAATLILAKEPDVEDRAQPSPVFTDREPAKNPVDLNLLIDDRKVLGWISGEEDWSGRPVTVEAGGRSATVEVGEDNTFVWPYRVEAPTVATFRIGDLSRSARVSPRPTDEPTVFFVVDRTVYRPEHTLKFAGFLRRPDETGEFVPVPDREVEVRLVSRGKKTTAAKLELTSDDFGRITGEYRFSTADALDTYDLSIEGYRGAAEVRLAEFRKAKVRLAIDGKLTDGDLALTFRALDFLDEPVTGSKVRFVARIERRRKLNRPGPLSPEHFVYRDPEAGYSPGFAGDEIENLLWEAGHFPATAWTGGATAVSEIRGEVDLKEGGEARHVVDLDPEWTGSHRAVISGVLTDYNGREQRATRLVDLDGDEPDGDLKLRVAKRRFLAGENVRLDVRVLDGERDPVEFDAAVVVQRITVDTTRFGPFGNGYFYPYAYSPYRNLHIRPYLTSGRYWSDGISHPGHGSTRRRLFTAVVVKDGHADLRLDTPGVYDLVCVAELPDGKRIRRNVPILIREKADARGLALELDREELDAGDVLSGVVHSRFGGARALLVLRDSRGIRFRRPLVVTNGAVRLRERLPEGLRYGVSVEVQYPDSTGRLHVAQKLVTVVPRNRMLTVKAETEEVYGPGEEVELSLSVNREEPVDLVVSVYDRSLLGIAADRAADVESFYLADDRVRYGAARDILRRRLSDVTVKTLAERARARLNEAPTLHGTALGAELKHVSDTCVPGGWLNLQTLRALLSLAGIPARALPGHHWVHLPWRFAPLPTDEERFGALAVHEIFDHTFNGWQIFCRATGGVIVLEERHPTRSVRPPPVFAAGYGLARGDARFSMSANAAMSNQFGVSGQAFISHRASPADAGDGGDPGTGISVRRNFSDAAFFDARVRTDVTGRATVRFKLPDSLTNWRVVVTAISREMHVGHTVAGFRTFKPVMVWPMLPRTFTVGDEVILYASVHNRTDTARDIDVWIAAENGRILSPERVTVRVEPDGNAPVYWRFAPEEAGFTRILMSARCDAGEDASEKRLPVRALAAEQVETASGYIDGPASIEVPADVDLSEAELTITLVPSLVDDMLDSLDFLVQYPHGCVEQTMSRFLPALRVAQTLERAEISDPALAGKLPRVVAQGVKRLLELQKPDGGWGWHAGGQTHEMMTPYALYGLLLAKEAGYEIPNAGAIDRGLTRLEGFVRSMGERQAADRVYCAYVLSLGRDLPGDFWSFVEQRTAAKNGFSDYATALALEMAVGAKKEELAAKLAAALSSRARRDGHGVHWTTAGFSRWGNDRFEITAAALKALVAHDPEHELIPSVLAFFASTKRGNRWNSTKATAMVVYAVCDYLASRDWTHRARSTATVRINDGEPRLAELSGGTVSRISIPGTELSHGKNEIRFDGGAPGVLFRAVLRYWKRGKCEPMADGLYVARHFHLLDENGAHVRILKDGGTVPRGSYIQCEVQVRHQRGNNMRYLLVEAQKPSSCEILPATEDRFDQRSAPYALRENMTEGVVLHHEQTGESIVDRFVLHAELAGTYAVPPTKAELMYDAETRGHSGTFVLKVE